MRCLYTPKGIIRRHTAREKKMHWQPCLCNSFRIIALAALKLLCLIFHVSKSQSRRGGGKSIARLNFKEIAESLLQVRPPKGDSLTCRPVQHLQKQPKHPRAQAAHGTEAAARGCLQAAELGVGKSSQHAKLPGTPPITDCISPRLAKPCAVTGRKTSALAPRLEPHNKPHQEVHLAECFPPSPGQFRPGHFSYLAHKDCANTTQQAQVLLKHSHHCAMAACHET